MEWVAGLGQAAELVWLVVVGDASGRVSQTLDEVSETLFDSTY